MNIEKDYVLSRIAVAVSNVQLKICMWEPIIVLISFLTEPEDIL